MEITCRRVSADGSGLQSLLLKLQFNDFSAAAESPWAQKTQAEVGNYENVNVIARYVHLTCRFADNVNMIMMFEDKISAKYHSCRYF